jgi:hypothetical protein
MSLEAVVSIHNLRESLVWEGIGREVSHRIIGLRLLRRDNRSLVLSSHG